MCGIIGITGRADAVDGVLDGLERLEYRGYDSAGVVVQNGDGLVSHKRAGRLAVLRADLDEQPLPDTDAGMGHTRWATHGAAVDHNAHPHSSPDGRVQVIHNGIIENYEALRATLPDATFSSETDTEVVAHLVAAEVAARGGPDADLLEAFRAVVQRLRGAYSLCVMSADHPGEIVVAKHEAPLIVAHADGVGYCASDVAALIDHSRDVAALLDDQLARITPTGVQVVDVEGADAEPHRYHVSWDVSAAEKGGYEHFMLKEIHEQPDAIRETLRDRLRAGGPDGTGPPQLELDECRIDEAELGRIDKVYIVACGTSLYAGMVAKYAIEHWAGIPVEVEVASEFRYRDPILDPHTLVIGMSQSGETTDTIAACAHARDQRAPVLSIVNVVGSTMAREADAVMYMHAGPEIAVASTKCFVAMITVGLLAGLYLGQQRGKVWPSEIADTLERLRGLPDSVAQVLDLEPEIERLAAQWKDVPYAMFIGRHVGLPVAYEGALKLKEISYLHAEAFPAGEMKHGPIALIEEGSLLVAIAPESHVFEKMVSNIQEVRARGASVLAVGTAGTAEALKAHADHVLVLPEPSHELAAPVLACVPLQLFAYHIAAARGEDVDKPRNLAKTVTVE